MKLFQEYIESLQEHEVSTVTEHTYRSALEKLLKELAQSVDKKISVQHEPKRQEGFGAPDFKIKYIEAIIGYVENKKLTEDLSKTLKSDQIKKYKSLSGNILVTNYLEWLWIKDGKLVDRVKLCDIDQIESRMAFMLDKGKVEQVKAMISNFFRQTPKGIGRPKQLAEALAIRARYLRDFLHTELLRQEKEHQEGRLYGLYETFKTNVFHELTQKEFADAFSQTLVYGLFLSKLNADTKTITLYNAKQFILPAFGLISELVDFLDELEKEYYSDARWIVEEILSVMNTLNLPSIAKNLSYEKFKSTNLFDENKISYKDPYIYFYEHFLAAYDKKLRKSKGVYYTPPQVVNFIVRSINDILKDTFGIEKGYADKDRVTVLDFATGTGTFLLEILEIIFEELPSGSGKKNLLIRDHVLKNFYGFEYMIAPYAVANLKLSQFLKEQGYELVDDDRFQIYLTNTLEPVDPQTKMPLLPALSKEAREAQKIKDNPILVITGNPPYSRSSKNVHADIVRLLREYKEGLNEKKLNLDDDYIKFVRFAQNKMNDVDDGIIGVITNNSFYDGVNHRRMRQSLLESFDQVFVVNLHGNSRLNETGPNGEIDENVFDILVGTGITILVKNHKATEKGVFYYDLYGSRREKYETLLELNLDITWEKIKPHSPYFLFKPFDEVKLSTENTTFSLKDIFAFSGSAIKTDRDRLFYDDVSDNLKSRMKLLLDDKLDSDFVERYNVKDSGSYKILDRIEKIQFEEKCIQECVYRPFDNKYVYYKHGLTSRPNYELNRNLIEENVCLISGRAGNVVSQNWFWNLAFVTSTLVDTNVFYRGGGFLFPLYTYVEDKDLFGEKNERRVNFLQEFHSFIETSYPQSDPIEAFGFIYGILNSFEYRKKYESLLNIDYPKIPFPNDTEVFLKVSRLGQQIINAHLLKIIPSAKDFPIGAFSGKGSNMVEVRDFTPDVNLPDIGKLHINTTQYFDKVPASVYGFFIGGYQVLDKYLKDRKGRELTLDEVENIENVIRVLAFTEGKMEEIDELTKDWI